MKVGAELKARREFFGIGLRQAARHLKLDSGNLTKIEKSKCLLPIKHFKKFVDYYEIDFLDAEKILDALKDEMIENLESRLEIKIAKIVNKIKMEQLK